MSDFTPPLRKIVKRQGTNEVLECGHEQPIKPNKAKRRRCVQCRRATVTVAERQEATEGARCPYCFDDFSDPELTTQKCTTCGAKLHEECWEENNGCTALGCRGNRSRMVVRPREPQPAAVVPQPAVAVAHTPDPHDLPRDLDARPVVPEFNDWFRDRIALVIQTAIVPLGLGTCLIWNPGVAILAMGLAAVLGWLIRPRSGR